MREIARTAAEVNSEVENIGARRLHTIMTTLLEDILFDADGHEHWEVSLNATQVREKLLAIVKNRDLSQYIL